MLGTVASAALAAWSLFLPTQTPPLPASADPESQAVTSGTLPPILADHLQGPTGRLETPTPTRPPTTVPEGATLLFLSTGAAVLVARRHLLPRRVC